MRSIIFAFILIASVRASASGFVLALGYGNGGKNLSEVTGGQNYDVKAGRGIYACIGTVLPVTPTLPHRFEAQFDIGIASTNDTSQGEDNKVEWTRIPVELVYFYRNTQEDFRAGYGPVLHILNHLNGNGSNASASTDFNDSIGWTAEIDKLLPGAGNPGGIGFGLKYSSIKYHSTKFNADADGSSLLVTVSILGWPDSR